QRHLGVAEQPDGELLQRHPAGRQWGVGLAQLAGEVRPDQGEVPGAPLLVVPERPADLLPQELEQHQGLGQQRRGGQPRGQPAPPLPGGGPGERASLQRGGARLWSGRQEGQPHAAAQHTVPCCFWNRPPARRAMVLFRPLRPRRPCTPTRGPAVKLSIVVPFYNELRTLPTVIERLLAVDFGALGAETELIFVD